MRERRDRDGSRAEIGLAGIMELAFGYQRAQTLFAANALGIFELLATGPRSAEEVADALGLEIRGVEALLEACTHLKLLHANAGEYRASRTAGLFLTPGRAGSFDKVLEFWKRSSYARWSRLADAVSENKPQTAQGTKTKDLFDDLVENQEQLELFFDGLAGLTYWPARKIVELVDLGRRKHLLDVGGGSGAFSAQISERFPNLQVTLFDLEPVCRLARDRFADLDFGSRLETVAGNFHTDALPAGADTVLLANVLHDWSADECRALVQKIHVALQPGGQIVIYEVMPGASPTVDASLFSLALLLDTERGQVYSFEQIRGWLEAQGFTDVRREEVTPATSLILAEKPKR